VNPVVKVDGAAATRKINYPPTAKKPSMRDV
jgi:hypothetical protein